MTHSAATTPGFPLSNRVWLRVAAVVAAGIAIRSTSGDELPPRRALLVGVADYQHLPDGEQLRGCANDVAAMKSVLRERFRFREDEIVTLVNEQATSAAIRAEFERVNAWLDGLPPSMATAQVVFHFSGHGSQLPDQPDGPDRDEDDGLDETLVPSDATRQGGPADIRDDELYRYAERICAGNRARLWVVLDCCHSGTGVRGATRVRQLTRDLPVPTEDAVRDQPAVRRQLPAGAVVFSACRAREVEPEYQDGATTYGLFTRFLVQVLNDEEQVSNLSVVLLRDAIIDCYRRDRAVVNPPAPHIEGDASSLDSAILGTLGQDRPAYWPVVAEGDDPDFAVLSAGALHGVTPGSLFELYTNPSDITWTAGPVDSPADPQAIAWLQVEEVFGDSARTRVYRWNGRAREEDSLPRDFNSGYAVERFHEHGEFGVRLKVVRAIDSETDGPPLRPESAETPAAIRRAMELVHTPDESPWCRWVDGDQPCDLILRIDGQQAALFPAAGVAAIDHVVGTTVEVPQSLRGGWGPIDLGDTEQAAQEIADDLRRVTRARNLLRLAHAPPETRESSLDGRSVDVRIELVAVEEFEPDGFTIKSWHPWTQDAEGDLRLRDSDIFAIRVTNASGVGHPVYVTILHVDADMGIDQILPWQNGSDVVGEQYLEPGQSRMTDAFTSNGNPAERPVYGQRRAVVLATRAPNQFYMLEQPSLARVRGSATLRIADPNRPPVGERGSLETLLLQQQYFQSRGASRDNPARLYDNSWGAAVVEWTATSDP
jgi:hypothetical protein